MILRLLNWQGAVGIAVALALAILLAVQKGETRHWKKQSAAFAQRYDQSQAAFTRTVADARAAAEAARAADRANAARVAAEQGTINQRSANDYETRLAAARAVAERLRSQSEAAADPGAGRDASVPGLSAPPGGASQAAGEDRFSLADRQVATEQAIQLDELIKWVRQQHAVRVDSVSGERPQAAHSQHLVDPNADAITRRHLPVR